jgi:hypothetical protein
MRRIANLILPVVHWINENGGKYLGRWNDDKKHDRGTYLWIRDHKYVGNRRHDFNIGQGTKIGGIYSPATGTTISICGFINE